MDIQQIHKPSYAIQKPVFSGPRILKTPPVHTKFNPSNSSTTTTIPIIRMNQEELQARREKGLCYKCDEKYVPGHKCKRRYLVLAAEDDIEERTETLAAFDHMSVTIFDNPQNHSEVALEESQFMEAIPEISIHALAGQLNFTTLRLTGRYGNHMMQVLVDNGSIHNFLKETVATRLGLSILPCKSFKVFVGNGQFLECSKKCHGVNLFI
ncbi:hypothetical protein CFOL_v3_31254 [Cephalotus follicularis]|uniref:Gag-asp_proteas domain-containing protein n=1 Tax=Cephalotus follicularis TaxID=3775 RepID=A0A1Q3D6F2_CEPFO|nr:hypothetical protein CFOL_v3_31254 [Cephalotus follicularis]